MDATTLIFHSVRRLAPSIVAVVASAADVRTVGAWAHYVGKSSKALRSHCRAAGIRPKDALDFARLLRASLLIRQFGGSLQDILDVVDTRTLRSLCERSCIVHLEEKLANMPTRQFVLEQKLVADARLRDAVTETLQRG